MGLNAIRRLMVRLGSKLRLEVEMVRPADVTSCGKRGLAHFTLLVDPDEGVRALGVVAGPFIWKLNFIRSDVRIKEGGRRHQDRKGQENKKADEGGPQTKHGKSLMCKH